MPTGCVSACPDLKVARLVQDAFMNDYFRVYTSEDIVGVELSAALKNVSGSGAAAYATAWAIRTTPRPC